MLNHKIYNHLYILFAFVFLLNVINIFLKNDSLNYVIGLLAIIMLAFSFLRASNLFKILGLSFILIGLFTYLAASNSVSEIPQHMTSNILLLTLLSMLPWMSSVVKSGGFDTVLKQLLQLKVNNLGAFYPRSSISTLTLASFLNLSAATISQDVLNESLKDKKRDVRLNFINTSTIRGFTLALVWSPLEIIVATVIFVVNVEFVALLPWLILVSLIVYVLDSIWGYFKYKPIEYSSVQKEIVDNKNIVINIIHLIFALALFLFLVIVIGEWLSLDFIFSVTVLIFPFAAIWSLLLREWKKFWEIGWDAWREGTNKMYNFIVLFITLSFFEYGLMDSNILIVIQKPFLYFSEYPIIIFIILQLFFIGLSMLGIHPVATIGILTPIVAFLVETINPLSLSIVMITGAVATLTVSTYGLLLQLTATNLKVNPYKITLTNLPFAMMYGLVGSIIAYLLL